jgi:hypothetical protein
MKSRPYISTRRAAEIFDEMIACRRDFCADNEFFRMTELLEWLCEGSERWSIKTYRSGEQENFKPAARVTAFFDRVTLTVDERLWRDAEQGGKLSNYILAHELGHLALGHHARNAGTKHFQLFAGPDGMINRPTNEKEFEANLAAVFFQCGVALCDVRWHPVQLAHRAFSDVHYVRKAQAYVQFSIFQQELNRRKKNWQRVVL